ncbi:hypothetical protein HOT74_gp17 [Microbacterium phage KaiHaiDragon]|uniref:Uncharacterized protein n=2 Tax=Quhwahvirus kaihaidragon TaxID=2283289 RepID=A0A345MHU8_9CAUD|nr:hypothetical protein HOT74_gp17 [Microbacterium phage KaiHaiDragon]AXH70129.1 hypothetical protein SEA_KAIHAIDRAGON_17 [Microbacterium phage KaiHaiDragon]QTF81534.1 hypothetical protein SEA_PULCHRA_18 [Microbacterium phage Pulchra]QXN74810.1 hypothetical protein SEA_PHRANCESCO_18 [Microbacterium phage Phrancesco]UVG34492.1 hypothetical protein EARICKHC_17 [Microbacterium phage EarickHC]
MTKGIPPVPDSPAGSYAWCTECAWKNDSDRCEALARAHGESFFHVVHVFEPSALDSAVLAASIADAEQEARDRMYDQQEG